MIHNHTYYSDGLNSPEEIVICAKKLGYTSVAITDHHTLGGAYEFYNSCKKHGVKPILGVELYVEYPEKFKYLFGEKEQRFPPHQLVIAKTKEGFENLIKLVNIGARNFYQKPRTDYEEISKHSQGITLTTGCYSSISGKLFAKEMYEEAKQFLEWQLDVFGVVPEIQKHNTPRIDEYYSLVELFSKEKGLSPLCAFDAHYAEKKDQKAFSLYNCGALHKKLSDYTPMSGDSYHLLPKETVKKVYGQTIYDNTISFCEKVEDYKIFEAKKPESEENSDNTLSDICYKKLADKVLQKDIAEKRRGSLFRKFRD